MVHSCLAAVASNSGGGGGPFRLLELDLVALPVGAAEESIEVVEALASDCLRRAMEPFRGSFELAESEDVYGSISFFCLEAGRISSRSTGTPRETRKSRLMRERVQFGGWRGGGATSWDQSERERSRRKTEFDSAGVGGGGSRSRLASGKRAERWGELARIISSRDLRLVKSRTD